MTFTNSISIKRLGNLLLKDCREKTNSILLMIAAITVFLIMNYDHSFITPLNEYLTILYFGGAVITSLSFSDLHNRSRAHLFLMLPCSNIERFLSKYLFSSVGYIIFSLTIYLLISAVISGLTNHLFSGRSELPNIFSYDFWLSIEQYLIVQSILFLGAITFKKHSLIKTLVVSSSIILVIIFVPLLTGWYIIANQYEGEMLLPFLFDIVKANYFIFWTLLGPFCLFLTYLKLKEIELK